MCGRVRIERCGRASFKDGVRGHHEWCLWSRQVCPACAVAEVCANIIIARIPTVQSTEARDGQAGVWISGIGLEGKGKGRGRRTRRGWGGCCCSHPGATVSASLALLLLFL